MRILLISPSQEDGTYLQKALRESAHSLQVTDDYRDGLQLGELEPYDAVIFLAVQNFAIANLGDMLPDFSRLPGAPALIAILSEASAPQRTRLLRLGVDACFMQPYSFLELQERMRALNRGATSSKSDLRTTPRMHLEGTTREVVEGETRMCVGEREFLLLECLLREVNAPISRERVIRYAWSEKETVDPATVNLVVSRLRKKLRTNGFKTRLETIIRYGYKLLT
jgi:two-component system, OmpR family, response regulator